MTVTLHEARKMWMALGSDARARVMAGEKIKVAQRVPMPPLYKTIASPTDQIPNRVHTFHAIRTTSIVGIIVTIYCDGEVIHVLKEWK